MTDMDAEAFRNYVANPDRVTLQDRVVKRTYHARVTEGAERDRLWKLASSIYPEYDTYQANATRQIPVVRLIPDE